ncbi:DUF6941 family protein [Candidatus Poriferisodalis sp.]|uniref:DUF6941 family protein n=1 Tax=Candidatus Poriferisodalis sp. TaxID=3101277 RepID=UPI003B5CEC7C
MIVRVAALCDYAQVRENLLTLASAGVTRAWRESYPARMEVMLALLIEISEVDAKMPHEVLVRVEDSDGGKIAEMTWAFQVGEIAELDPGEMLVVPGALDLRLVQLPKEGRYQVVVVPENAGEIPLSFRAGFASDRPAEHA